MSIVTAKNLVAFTAPGTLPAMKRPPDLTPVLKFMTIRASAILTPTDTRRMTVLYTPEFKKHRPPPGRSHPECPARLDVCVDALKKSSDLSGLLDWVTPQSVSETVAPQRRQMVLDAVRVVHRFPDYLDMVEHISKRGGGGIDSDTYISPDTYEVALLAASAWLEAVDVAMGDARAAWALTRPPGHHATPAAGMGFCLLSNAAIAAKYALNHKGVSSVAILDFDVHHGNGTEASVKMDKRIRFASSHQWPMYPGSGPEGTSGISNNVLNINLERGTSIQQYRHRFEHEMLPFLMKSETGSKPDLVIVSAGYDALDVDPLAQLDFKPSDYRLFTQLLMEAGGNDMRVVFGLEGGYDLTERGLSAGVTESIAGYCLPNEDKPKEV